MKNDFSIYICGTPSNKLGFRYSILQGDELLDIPAKYLDLFEPSQMTQGKTYILKREFINNKFYTIVTEYRAITPNDQGANRGAFIAVSIVANRDISYNDSLMFFDILSEIHGNLFAYRDKNNAFDPRFALENYRIYKMYTDINISYLTQTLSKLSLKTEKDFHHYSLMYNEYKYKNRDINVIKTFTKEDEILDPKEEYYSNEIEILAKKLDEKDGNYERLSNEYTELENKYEYELEEFENERNTKDIYNDKLLRKINEIEEALQDYKYQNTKLKQKLQQIDSSHSRHKQEIVDRSYEGERSDYSSHAPNYRNKQRKYKSSFEDNTYNQNIILNYDTKGIDNNISFIDKVQKFLIKSLIAMLAIVIIYLFFTFIKSFYMQEKSSQIEKKKSDIKHSIVVKEISNKDNDNRYISNSSLSSVHDYSDEINYNYEDNTPIEENNNLD